MTHLIETIESLTAAAGAHTSAHGCTAATCPVAASYGEALTHAHEELDAALAELPPVSAVPYDRLVREL